MTREKRMHLIAMYITAFKCRELSPEWYVCFSPEGRESSVLHICRPFVWERLLGHEKSWEMGRGPDPMKDLDVGFTSFREHRCWKCNTVMPTWAVTLGRLFILGSKI